MKKVIKNNKGITMVSLVVTIIILIILSGITLNMIIGNNGILTIAKRAKENTELAQQEEKIKLNELYTQIENETGTTGGMSYDAIAKLNDFKKAIADYIEEAGGIKPEYTASAETFGESIKGIVKEVTKDATATADNITEGKTAWVNGELITGTGKDNKTHYESGKDILEYGTFSIPYASDGQTITIKFKNNYSDANIKVWCVQTSGAPWSYLSWKNTATQLRVEGCPAKGQSGTVGSTGKYIVLNADSLPI